MKTKTILAMATIGAALTFSARADIIDNFDSYATEAAFDAAWTLSSGTGLDLYTAQFVSSPNCSKEPGHGAAGKSAV